MNKTKSIFKILFLIIALFSGVVINAQTLKLHYGLSNDTNGSSEVIDETGNGHNGSLINGATISTYDNLPVIDLGTTNGYVDMGASVGNIISGLTNFTIVTKMYIPTTTSLNSNGNFVWTFSNSNNIGSDANGCIFFSARNGRYAITKTNYTAESGVQTGSAIAKGSWKTLIYTQNEGVGRIFIDGNVVTSGNISVNPSQLGSTSFNYLGRSCYSSDAYLSDVKIADFRIYDGALNTQAIEELSDIDTGSGVTELLTQFDFNSTSDLSNTYTGSLNNGAEIVDYADRKVLDLGSSNGYFNFSSNFGNVISSLDSFTISTNIMIPDSISITGNGNFIWTFANTGNMESSAVGGMFFAANTTRYAITKTNYSAESGVKLGTAANKGKWKNITYTQINGVGRIFIDGLMVAKNSVSIKPYELGNTGYNYLGRSCYSTDAYLKNAKFYRFQIFKGAMKEDAIQGLCNVLGDLNRYADSLRLVDALPFVDIANKDSIRSKLALPSEIADNVSLSWSSSNTDVLTNDGSVFRPGYGSDAVSVTLTVELSSNGVSVTKDIIVTVLPQFSDSESVAIDLSNLKITGNINNARSSVGLPYRTLEGSKIVWKSNSPDYMNNVGRVVKLATTGAGKKRVVLTATVSKGDATATKDFEVYIAEDEQKVAYLFSYFTGNDVTQEQIHFALSGDGYNYIPLNDGKPIMSSDTISIKGGVRDPHILRGDDGYFYMVVTDMKSSEGWSSNRGMVLLRSNDLVNWTHSTVHFPTKWPEKWANVTRVWAPQTIFDPIAQKYMVYFSLLTNDGTCPYDQVFYCYANEDFTDLEGEPIFLFDRGSATIDGDIVFNEADNLYHMYFKNEGVGGICQVTASRLTAEDGQPAGSQWGTPSEPLQQTDVAVEGVGLFRLINQDKWIMMYDCYTSGYYQFCSSSDLNNFTFVQNVSDMDARHGTSLAVSAEEVARLLAAFPSSSLINEPLGARNGNVKHEFLTINKNTMQIDIPVHYGVDLSNFDPMIFATPGTEITPSGLQDFTKGTIQYTFKLNGSTAKYNVNVRIAANPVIPGFHADPEILYSEKTGMYYIYPTTDGYPGWGGYSFDVFASPDMVNWINQGTFLDLSTSQVSWATGNAWAPCIIEKKLADNDYRYYFYFSGESGGKKIGVAVSDHPTGPFVDSGSPMISNLPAGVSGGQQIDGDVFKDPVSGKSYFYYGNGYMAVVELNDDMVSVKEETTTVLTPQGGTLSTYAYREAPYVFYRNGLYYFLWSVDDTGSPNYHVAYGTSASPMGPIEVASNPIVIIQDADNYIFGTAHNSIIQIKGKDEWYIVYHRINKDYLSNSPGIHREVCIDKLTFNDDGTIIQVTPTNEGIQPVDGSETSNTRSFKKKNQEKGEVISVQYININGVIINPAKLNNGIYLVRKQYLNGNIEVEKIIYNVK
ncbi:MAG: family 43 glycosylhydrolase [Marinilabiliaceae bacterium]|nr:family 43 glycosylhydrolase [Marinilabiliaceae bacterium]